MRAPVIDRDIHRARALVVENNAQRRTLAIAQLRNLGVGHVAHARRTADARRMIEQQTYDIIVCAHDFDGLADSGQDLLDELRRENQLPHGTVFIMATSRATYHQVMEGAEALLDGLLVRPYTGEELARRLLEARRRKRELADILRAMDQGRPDLALGQALARFKRRKPYASYCGRLAAELLLRQGRWKEALALFEQLAGDAQAATWARLGTARALIAGGDEARARQTLTELLTQEPGCADAHDLLGRLWVERCDFDHAWHCYEQAARLTPGCLLRAQHAGALAFYRGRRAEATELLERALKLGVQSKLFDALTLLLVAILRFDHADTPGLTAMHEQLIRFRQRHAESPRLQRLERAAVALLQLRAGAPALALAELRALGAQLAQDDFDLEAACVLLAVWARLPAGVAEPDEHEGVLRQVAQRFCISRAYTEVLLAVAGREGAVGEIIRGTQARIAEFAEAAVERALVSDPLGAAQALLAEGEATLNAKLLQMAGAIAGRHGAAAAGGRELQQRAGAVLRRSCKSANHIAGIQRSGRSPGALQLRGPSTPTEPLAHATA